MKNTINFIKIFLTKDNSYRVIAWTGIALFVILALIGSWQRSFNHDEFEAIHSAWKVSVGEKIYVDFFQQHHFLLYYLMAGIISLVGSSVKTIIVLRLFIFAMALGIGWLTYQIARMTWGKNVAVLSLFFLSTAIIFLQKVIEVRPDVPYTLMGLAAVFLLLKYFESRKMWQFLLSAAFLFISFLFLQKAVFLIFLIGLVFLYQLWKKKINYKEFFIYWGMMGVFASLFVWYVSVQFSLSQYFFINWIINTKLLNTFPLFKYLIISMEQNPLLWVLYFLGLIVMCRKKEFNLVAFLSIGLLGSIFLTKAPFPQYYLISLPFIAIVAGSTAYKLLSWRRSLIAIFLLASGIVSVAVLFYVSESNAVQLKKIAYILSITDSNDQIYDGDANFNVFRKDIDYFWFSVKPKTGVLIAYQMMRPYDYNIYRSIDKFRPKVVSSSFIKKNNPVIVENYVQSEKYKDFFIRK